MNRGEMNSLIEIKGLNKKYKYKIIFSNFNLIIKKKERIGLFAPNGTGKSTLLNILARIDRDYEGHVLLRSTKLSYVHQNFYETLLPWFNCRKNILMIRNYFNLNKYEGEKIMENMIKKLGINFSLESYPFKLSGGQQQIVAILRALIITPDILLLDEPFSAIDIEKRLKMINIIKKYTSKNSTIIVSSHRGDEIKELINRAIILEGNPIKIKKDIKLTSLGTKKFKQIVSKIRFKVKK